MQKEIKILMLHPYCKDVESFLNYTRLKHLKKKYNFVWDINDPHYIFVSENINTNQAYRDVLKRMYYKNNIKIFYAAEAEYPDFNIYDYAIGFCKDLKLNDRYISLPSPYIMFNNFITTNVNNIDTKEKAKIELYNKTGFCNFLYSNYNAHPFRDYLFYEISKYKHVDSLGKHLNNVNVPGTGFQGHQRDCINIKNKYKFSIASENASFPGYTSEKILTSLEAHTVPIYFGDPQICNIVNPNCFINCNNLSSIDEIIHLIKKIDEDDDLWCDMISQPWQTATQYSYNEKLNTDYFEFFNYLFSSELEKLKRIDIGTRPNVYRSYYFNAKAKKISYFSILKNKIKKHLM